MNTYRNELKFLSLSEIKIGPRIRKDLGDIDSLAESISELGLLQPILVNQNNLLIAGERRFNAAKKLGWKEIPALVMNFEI